MKKSCKHILLLLLCLLLPVQWSLAQETERSFKVINAANGLADNSSQIVKGTLSGRIIISTIGNLNFYDGKTFTHADVHPENEFKLPLYHGHYHMYFDGLYHIWLKDKVKVTCLDMMTERFVENVDSIIRSIGCDERVLDLFADQYGHMWFLTAQGLFSPYYHRTFTVQRDRSLQDVDMMGSTIYTFYDNGEVVGCDTLGNVVCQAKAYDWTEGQNYASSSVLLPYGDGFFQIRNGEHSAILLFFDTKTHTFSEVLRPDYHLNNMVEDPTHQHIYIPSEYGYWIYTPATKESQHIDEVLLSDGSTMATDCNTVAFDRQGGMWIGTEKRGVLYSRPHSTAIKAYTWAQPEALYFSAMTDSLEQNITEYEGKKAFCKLDDSRGWSWIGTRTGLFCERPGETVARHYTKRDGLGNEVIHALVEDLDHNIWVATSCGIAFFRIEDGEVTFINNFTADDNVPNESFDNCKALCTADGTIIMKAIGHVVAFNPDDLKELNSPHQVNNITPKLVRLLVNGDEIVANTEYDGNVIIDRVPSRVRSINLNSDQNSISLIFSALNYSRPLQTYYRVKVRELGDEWQVFSHHTSAFVDDMGLLRYTMTNLLPGDYHIEVQTSMFPDLWEESIPDGRRFEWEVHVKQPWWRTTGIFYLMGVVLLGLLLANFVLYNRNTRMRDRRNMEEGDIIRKIRFFVERCNEYSNQKLTLQTTPFIDKDAELSPEFIEMMMKLMPFMDKHDKDDLTMYRLSKAAGTDVAKFYEVVIGNLHKNPRELVMLMKLRRGAELLSTTDMTIEQIAGECGFYTPNFFIGNFFHIYKQTPDEYRRKMRNR